MDVSEESSKSMSTEVIAHLQESSDSHDQLSKSAFDAIRSVIREELMK